MRFGYLTILVGLSLSIVAAWFAIEGIVTIFAGLPVHVIVMGIVIEAGKVMGISWIYRNWNRGTKLKYVMIVPVVAGMLLTSIGIFGLLSKAHLEQTSPVANNTSQISRLDQRIAREQREISTAETTLAQLDAIIQTLIDARRISDPEIGSIVRLAEQEPQRAKLKTKILESLDMIDEYEDKKLTLTQEMNELHVELGPIKYIAALIFEDPKDHTESTVRYLIIAFMFVFDPMAILLLMAGNYTILNVNDDDKKVETISDCTDVLDAAPIDNLQAQLDELVNKTTPLTLSEVAQQIMLKDMLHQKQNKKRPQQKPKTSPDTNNNS